MKPHSGPACALLAAICLLPAVACRAAAPVTQEIVDAAPKAAWQPVPPGDLLVMRLAGGQRVVIQLAEAFAPAHVANIRLLARAGWWGHASIVRVQDNYVVQWADPDETRKRPAGVIAEPPAEYERPAAGMKMHRLGYGDAYAPLVGFADGWPAGSDGKRVWLTHCYGMVGVGRDLPPDTGDGSELYAVIGQAPRHLDRNIALVGRVLDGMPVLAALPRGTAEMGFYGAPAQRIAIRSLALASDMPAAAQPRFMVMRTDAPEFAAYLEAKANRRDPFFVRPAAALDICNAPVPVRAGGP